MINQFVHSVKVPRLYKTSANIVKEVQENGGSLKSLIFEKKHPNVSGVYALTATTLQKRTILDQLLLTTNILTNEPRLNEWLARILITELLWGKGSLTSECKPVLTVKSYEKDLRDKLKIYENQYQDEKVEKKAIVRKPRYVRVNTLIISVDEIVSKLEREGWTLLPKATSYSSYLRTLRNLEEPNFIQDFHIPEVLVFPHKVSFHDHESYFDGEILLQDKASCLPAFLLDPPPGSTVLDMCAAPGMKTTQLAAIMRNKGVLYATELESKRYTTLCNLVKKTKSTCVQPMKMDALTLDKEQYGNVEYILVDPSCSGSGMTDQHSRAEDFSAERLAKLQSFQVFLLRHALLSFPSVKKVVYSTCSINESENEQVVQEIMQNIGDAYRLVSMKEVLGDKWKNFSDPKYKCGDKCLYAKTPSDLTNGFFIAVFERNFDVPLPEYKKKGSKAEKRIDPEHPAEVKESRKRKKRGKKKSKDVNTADQSEAVEGNVEENTDEKESAQEQDEEPAAKKKKKKKKEDNADLSSS